MPRFATDLVSVGLLCPPHNIWYHFIIVMSSPMPLSHPIALANGDLTLRNGAALAPMAGMTDVPFRTLAWSFGAGHMVSEMVTAKP
mgnify:FL=1